jgi:hypothetical protein
MSKQRYHGPDIVEVGDVASITTANGEPVRDNPGQEPPDWYDASKDPTHQHHGKGKLADEDSGSEGSAEA